ncbi:MAG: GGDEF domain-containing protein, partial [Methylovulum sp.]|nr:GGDEF domain-containing protein [Methylovulum sp.]
FIAGIGIADFMTGSELSFSLFYLLPIVLVTWFSGRSFGLAISVIAAITWLVADTLAGHIYSHAIISYWNALMRLGFFVVVTLLLPALKALEHERENARVDYLTGAVNRRAFFELAETELNRSQRYKYPFTIAFIDLDGFKIVNDHYGHNTGDHLLCAVVKRANGQLRKSDCIARLGGDEFILLLPQTDLVAAQMTVSRIQSALLDEMKHHGWPVTFSIGFLTYRQGSITAEELIDRADNLMYTVKKNGKNAIASEVFES